MPAFAALVARHRAWVLAAAVLLGIVAAGGLSSGPAPARHGVAPDLRVADLVPGLVPVALASVPLRLAAADATPAQAQEADEAAEPAPPAPAAKKGRKSGASVGITVDDDSGKVRVIGGDGSREFDSFEQFIDQAPWIAGLVFAVTFLIFLTPILIIALVIWYKMRKARMMNETMIRLAEKGVVPTAEAFGAVATGASTMRAMPSAAPLYEQAKEVRRRAVWSDLRKGIIVGAVGLGFTFYSMLDDGSPNFVGLVLLFVGLAYVVLWYFEDRQAAPSAPTAPPPPPPPVA